MYEIAIRPASAMQDINTNIPTDSSPYHLEIFD